MSNDVLIGATIVRTTINDAVNGAMLVKKEDQLYIVSATYDMRFCIVDAGKVGEMYDENGTLKEGSILCKE